MTGFVLELLDQDEHACLHSWPLGTDEEVTIGRSPECSIMLGNRFVSRRHARLERSRDGWTLVSESDLGVHLDGRPIERAALDLGTVFRLGDMGPSLRLLESTTTPIDAESTIRMKRGDVPVLRVDAEQRDREVDAIVDSDFFSRLKERAARLRGGHATTPERGDDQG
jgi:pSer/pThr/pTyr-binding forkhead associated (FHA) protein